MASNDLLIQTVGAIKRLRFVVFRRSNGGSFLKAALSGATLWLSLAAAGSEHEIIGTVNNDRLVGTPGTDYFVGGLGADVFVINHLSEIPDEIADFNPEHGDAIELAFDSKPGLPFKQENFSIDRKGVVKVRIGARQQDVVRLNRADLRLELDPRKGRYFLKFSKKFR